jgi:hypothetical protein
MSIIRQTSFAGGELSPDYYARSEMDRYRIGAKSLLNYIVTPSGKASNRPGSQLCEYEDLSNIVAVNSSTTKNPNKASVSSNGVTWSLYSIAVNDLCFGAASNGLSFVTGGANNHDLSTDGGATWSAKTRASSGYIYDYLWTGQAYLSLGQAGNIERSTDGSTWVHIGAPYAASIRGSVAADIGGVRLVVAVGDVYSSHGLCILSRDHGLTWSHVSLPVNSAYLDVATDGDGVLIAVTNGYISRSTDGVSWSNMALTGNHQCIVHADGLWWIFDTTTTAHKSSDGGFTWTDVTISTATANKAVWTGRRIVVAGSDGFAVSTDAAGTSWSWVVLLGEWSGITTKLEGLADTRSRLVPFIFSDEQALVLEFRDKSVRFLLNGSYVMSGASPYQVTTPYLVADLPRLKFAQMGNVITIAHPDYSPRELVRTATSPLTFTFTALTFPAMRVNIPREVPWSYYGPKYPFYSVNWNTIKYDTTIITGTPKLYGWLITTICQSLDGARTWESVGNLISHLTRIDTATYPSWLGTWSAATTYAANDYVAFAVGGQIFHFKSLAGGNLNNPPVTGYTVDDTWWAPELFGVGYMDLVEVQPELQWADPDATDCRVINYCIYRVEGSAPGELGFPGLIAVLDKGARAFVDDGSIGADFLQRPPKGENPFAVYNYDNTILRTEDPSTVVYQDERLIFGGTAERPNYLFMSRTGDWHNFDQYPLVKDDDSITVGLAGRRFEEIRSLIPGRSLLVLTTMSEWAVDGGQPDEPMTPTAISARIRSERGCTWLDGLKVGDDHCLFVQRKGTVVRDLMFDGQAGTYVNRDLSLFSHHLFVGKQVIDWCWAEDPWSVIWAVLDDGTLLSFTFLPEQQVFAWARHEIGGDGVVESICSIPEGEEDAVYVVVRRGAVRSIERFATRQITSATESVFLDGSVSYSFGTATTAITGLTHLAGLVVYALADGLVQGPFTVSSSGTITLATAALRVHVGLKYNADFESLDCSPGEGKTRVKSVKTAWVELEASAGSIQAGEDFTHLDTWSGVEADETAKVSGLTTGQARIPTISHWNHGGRVCIRQSDPLPITILAVIREVEYGG